MDRVSSLSLLAKVRSDAEKQAALDIDNSPATPTEEMAYGTGSIMGGGVGGGAAGALGGGSTGALLGLMLANRSQDQGLRKRLKQGLGLGLGGLAGAVAGGVGGSALGGVAGRNLADAVTAPGTGGLSIHSKAGSDAPPFADAVQQMQNQAVRTEAMGDVRNMALAALGVGLGARGLVGLLNMMRKPKPSRSGPAELPVPVPADHKFASDTPPPPTPAKMASFLGGDMASTKAGIPWYGPTMMTAGLGAGWLGWKGLDSVLHARREQARKQELQKARQEFHDALLSQYAEPKQASDGTPEEPSTMTKVGRELDGLFDDLDRIMPKVPGITKVAGTWADVGGALTGGYGIYAGLSGLLTGALVYDKIKKRSQAAILEKALQKRQRRKFNQAPTEIYATPEPVDHMPQLTSAGDHESFR